MDTTIKQCRVAVLGAGVTGVCTAHYLAETYGPHEILVLDASKRPGGFARTERDAGFQLDWGPNGFLNREPLMLEWVADLGLTNHLREADAAAARRFILKNERLMEIKGPPGFLVSPILSVKGRMRLLCEPLIRKKQDDRPESIYDFATRRIGREAADMLVSPMVTGVFGGDAQVLSLAHCFPRMAAMERDYGTLFKAMKAKKKENKEASAMGPSGVLTTFDEGIGTLAETVSRELRDRILLNTKVTGVESHSSHFRVVTEDGTQIEAPNVVVALPAHKANGVLAGLDDKVAQALGRVKHCNIVVVCTAYHRDKVGQDMKGFGFLVPRSEKKRILGCIWTSSVFPHQVPDGWVLLRTMIGGATDMGAVDLSDSEIMECIRREIHPLMKIDTEPDMVQIFRHRQAIPQYGLDHEAVLTEVAAAEARHPGLYFAGNAYKGVGLNDCVVSAVGAVRRLAERQEEPRSTAEVN